MVYLLFFVIDKDRKIEVGKLGEIFFKKGEYIYVGSAKRSFEKRIKRHLRKKKKKFWHIDYLLSGEGKIKKIFLNPYMKECEAAKIFLQKNIPFIKNFGSSDCKCPSHLFYLQENFPINFVREENFYEFPILN